MVLKSLLPLFAWAAFIMVLMVIPGNSFPEKSWVTIPHADKIVHFVLFFILGVLYYPVIANKVTQASFPKKLFWISFSLGIFYAICTETIQWAIVSSRKGSLWDLLADILGLITGLGLAIWFARRQNCRLCRLFEFLRE